jgi:hypothetical protein
VNFLNLGFGFVLLIDLAFAWHIIRTGRSPLWIMAVALIPPPIGWIIYAVFALVPDMMGSVSARRFADNVASAADPGRSYREKKQQVERVGSVDAKRALAEECLKRGQFADEVALYESAMAGPLGGGDPTLLKGMGRAKLLSGDGAAAAALFQELKAVDPAAFDADVELDYARSLALQGQHDAAADQYEAVVTRYPGEEARCRFALLLEEMGQHERAQAYFREIIASVKGAPRYYRSRQSEWVRIARQHLKS